MKCEAIFNDSGWAKDDPDMMRDVKAAKLRLKLNPKNFGPIMKSINF